jgi:hypothetical protein
MAYPSIFIFLSLNVDALRVMGAFSFNPCEGFSSFGAAQLIRYPHHLGGIGSFQSL